MLVISLKNATELCDGLVTKKAEGQDCGDNLSKRTSYKDVFLSETKLNKTCTTTKYDDGH